MDWDVTAETSFCASQYAGAPCSCAVVKRLTLLPLLVIEPVSHLNESTNRARECITKINLVLVTSEFPRRDARISSASMRASRSSSWSLTLYTEAVVALIVQPVNSAAPDLAELWTMMGSNQGME